VIIQYFAEISSEEIKKESFKSGIICDIQLAYLLAADGQYTFDQFMEIWSIFGASTGGPKHPDFSTPKRAIQSWFDILNIFVKNGLSGVITRTDQWRTSLLNYYEHSEMNSASRPRRIDKAIYFEFRDIAKYFRGILKLPEPLFCKEYEESCLPPEYKYQKTKEDSDIGKKYILDHLNLKHLKCFAKRWLAAYAIEGIFIEKISICKIEIPSFVKRDTPWGNPQNYGIIFYCPTYSDEDMVISGEEFQRMVESRPLPPSTHQTLLGDIEKSNFQLESDSPLFSNFFDAAYKSDLPKNFRREWRFFIKGDENDLPSYLDMDTEIVLFPELDYEQASIINDDDDDKKTKNPKYRSNNQKTQLIKKYTAISIKYCQGFKDRGEQAPSRPECEKYITERLRKVGEKLGLKKILPERELREVWGGVPEKLKRNIGVITKKRK